MTLSEHRSARSITVFRDGSAPCRAGFARQENEKAEDSIIRCLANVFAPRHFHLPTISMRRLFRSLSYSLRKLIGRMKVVLRKAIGRIKRMADISLLSRKLRSVLTLNPVLSPRVSNWLQLFFVDTTYMQVQYNRKSKLNPAKYV